jgi:hypothetical protein
MSVTDCPTCTTSWGSGGKRPPCLSLREIVKKTKVDAAVLIRTDQIAPTCPFAVKSGNELARILVNVKYPRVPMFTGPNDQLMLKAMADQLFKADLQKFRDLDAPDSDFQLRNTLSLGNSGPFIYSPHDFPVYIFHMSLSSGYSWDAFANYYFVQVLPYTKALSGWRLTSSSGAAATMGAGDTTGAFTVQHTNDKTFKTDAPVNLNYDGVALGAAGASYSASWFPTLATDIYLGSLARDNIGLSDLRGPALMCDAAAGILIAGQAVTCVWFGCRDLAKAGTWTSMPDLMAVQAMAYVKFTSPTVTPIMWVSKPNFYALTIS